MAVLTTNIDSRTSDKIMEDTIMPAIVEFPTVVKEALEQFGHLFANEPERVHFAEYLTGLMVAYHKNSPWDGVATNPQPNNLLGD